MPALPGLRPNGTRLRAGNGEQFSIGGPSEVIHVSRRILNDPDKLQAI